MPVTIRATAPTDAVDIARVRVASWRVAYDGLIDQALLERLDADREGARRADEWEAMHADPLGSELVAEEDGVVIGWSAFGPARDEGASDLGELYSLYVVPDRWSTGAGHALLAACEATLRSRGFTRAYLWVLGGNDRAGTFYERHGWLEDGLVKVDEGTTRDGVRYQLREHRRVRDLTVHASS